MIKNSESFFVLKNSYPSLYHPKYKCRRFIETITLHKGFEIEDEKLCVSALNNTTNIKIEIRVNVKYDLNPLTVF